VAQRSTHRQAILSLTLLAAVAASLLMAPGLEGVMGALLATLMLAIAASDFRRYIIPNELTAAAAALALLRAGLAGRDAGWEPLLWTAGRALAVAVLLIALMSVYRWWRGRDGMGLGDVKLAAVAGAWLGLATLLAVIEIAALSALGAYLLTGLLRKRPLKATAFLPFGVFLAPSIWLGWLMDALVEWHSVF
jgi:leader peptidase (prepilin peptidase)/N-methyltransferase